MKNTKTILFFATIILYFITALVGLLGIAYEANTIIAVTILGLITVLTAITTVVMYLLVKPITFKFLFVLFFLSLITLYLQNQLAIADGHEISLVTIYFMSIPQVLFAIYSFIHIMFKFGAILDNKFNE